MLLKDVKCYLIVVSVCVSVMTRDVEHLFTCLFPVVSLLCRNVYPLIGLFIFVVVLQSKVLCIFLVLIPYQINNLRIFSPSLWAALPSCQECLLRHGWSLRAAHLVSLIVFMFSFTYWNIFNMSIIAVLMSASANFILSVISWSVLIDSFSAWICLVVCSKSTCLVTAASLPGTGNPTLSRVWLGFLPWKKVGVWFNRWLYSF